MAQALVLLALLMRLWLAGWQRGVAAARLRVALARAGALALLFVWQGVARLLAQL